MIWGRVTDRPKDEKASVDVISVRDALQRLEAGERTVRFWFKDKKQHRRVYVQCSLEEFVYRWSQHIPERYQLAVRSFGLFAPRFTVSAPRRLAASRWRKTESLRPVS